MADCVTSHGSLQLWRRLQSSVRQAFRGVLSSHLCWWSPVLFETTKGPKWIVSWLKNVSVTKLPFIAWTVTDACDRQERKTADRPFCLIASEVWDRRSPRRVPWAQTAVAPSADPLYGETTQRKWNSWTRNSIRNRKQQMKHAATIDELTWLRSTISYRSSSPVLFSTFFDLFPSCKGNEYVR